MYKAYYGFKEKPFQTTPDPARLFMSKSHADAYTHLKYAIQENKGFVVLTGETGSGKTSLLNLLIGELGTHFEIGVLNRNIARPEWFMETVCRQFGLDVNGMDTTGISKRLRDFLVRQRDTGNRVILIVDEAHDLSDTAIEGIRMLANLETEGHYLIQIILAGRPELTQKLQHNRVREFVQRAVVHCHLSGLDRDEVGQYIHHRLQHAGETKNSHIFDHEAIESIYMHSGGVPRLTNLISDAALVYGYADELKTIGKRVIEEVVKDRGVQEVPTGDMPQMIAPSETVHTEMGGREINKDIRQDIEKKIQTLEDTIHRINQELHTQNSARKDRYEVGLELMEILRRMETRLILLLENIRSFLH
jgi:general secretion pathway protein A